MAAKQLIFDEQARQAILRGVQKLSKAVVATLGPKGRNVVIDKKFGSPTITKDGVTVAKEIELEDPYENMGAQMVREVASKTSAPPVTARPRRQYWPSPFTARVESSSHPVPTRSAFNAASTRPSRPPWASSTKSPRR